MNEYEQRKQHKTFLWKLWWIALVSCIGIALISGIIVGHYQYNYELNKCSNLKGSSYNFNIDAQVNAEYAQDCFYYKNHPLAYIETVLSCCVLLILLFAILLMIPFSAAAINIDNY